MYFPLAKWAGRKSKRLGGYVLVFVPEHPKNFNGWYYEHRLVYEHDIKRVLETWETVHHINQIKTDNRLCNLFVCTESEHRKAHLC
jgi:HNH endonuclease